MAAVRARWSTACVEASGGPLVGSRPTPGQDPAYVRQLPLAQRGSREILSCAGMASTQLGLLPLRASDRLSPGAIVGHWNRRGSRYSAVYQATRLRARAGRDHWQAGQVRVERRGA